MKSIVLMMVGSLWINAWAGATSSPHSEVKAAAATNSVDSATAAWVKALSEKYLEFEKRGSSNTAFQTWTKNMSLATTEQCLFSVYGSNTELAKSSLKSMGLKTSEIEKVFPPSLNTARSSYVRMSIPSLRKNCATVVREGFHVNCESARAASDLKVKNTPDQKPNALTLKRNIFNRVEFDLKCTLSGSLEKNQATKKTPESEEPFPAQIYHLASSDISKIEGKFLNQWKPLGPSFLIKTKDYPEMGQPPKPPTPPQKGGRLRPPPLPPEPSVTSVQDTVTVIIPSLGSFKWPVTIIP